MSEDTPHRAIEVTPEMIEAGVNVLLESEGTRLSLEYRAEEVYRAMTAQMSERKYSVSEIDRMRKAIRWIYPDGIVYREAERSAEVENRLRTYMQNGTNPEELDEQVRQRLQQLRKRHA